MGSEKREPIKNPRIWIILGILLAMITPWYFPASFGEILVYGVPLWAVIIVLSSLLLSAYLSYVLKYHWMLEEDEEEAEQKGAK